MTVALAAATLIGCAGSPPAVIRAASPAPDPYLQVGPVSSGTVVRRVATHAPRELAAAARQLVRLSGAPPTEAAVRVVQPTPELQRRLIELEQPAIDVVGAPEHVDMLERFLADRVRYAGREAVLSVSLERFEPGELPQLVARSRLRERDVVVVEGPIDASVEGERIADAAAYVEDGLSNELEGPIEVLGVQWFRVQRGPRTSLGLNAEARVVWTGEGALEPGVVALEATYRRSWDRPLLRFSGRAVLRPGEEMWLFERPTGEDGVWVLRCAWMNKAAWEQLVERWQEQRSTWHRFRD